MRVSLSWPIPSLTSRFGAPFRACSILGLLVLCLATTVLVYTSCPRLLVVVVLLFSDAWLRDPRFLVGSTTFAAGVRVCVRARAFLSTVLEFPRHNMNTRCSCRRRQGMYYLSPFANGIFAAKLSWPALVRRRHWSSRLLST